MDYATAIKRVTMLEMKAMEDLDKIEKLNVALADRNKQIKHIQDTQPIAIMENIQLRKENKELREGLFSQTPNNGITAEDLCVFLTEPDEIGAAEFYQYVEYARELLKRINKARVLLERGKEMKKKVVTSII